ncbi:hypothetical protein V8E53_006928 [Lactarius tabidus]
MPGSAVVDLRDTLGAALIGFLVSTVLFGLTLGQTWLYYWYYWTKDRKALKIFIAFITILDTILTIITAYAMYWYLIPNFGNVAAGHKWVLSVQANMTAISATAVELYYARRIYVVSQTIFPALVIVILCILGNVLGFYVAAKQLTTQVNVRYKTLIAFGYLGMGETIVVDVLITAMMTWALYRKKTGFARTDSVIMTLMAYTINTGLLTTILGTVMVILFITSPDSLVPEAIFWVTSKCYVNSVLAMLNSRDYVRDRRLATDISDSDNSYNLTSIRVDPADDAYEPQIRQGDIPVIVHHSASSDVAPTFEIPILDMAIPSQSQSQSSASSA